MQNTFQDADDVIYALKKCGWTQVAVSRELDVDISTVNNVIHRRTVSRRIAGFIAGQLGRKVDELWPGLY